MANDNLSTAIANTPAASITKSAAAQASHLSETYKMAKVFAGSQFVPKHLQGKTDDCFIALLMAEQLGCSPIMVMQNITVVSGTAGWKAPFVIGMANDRGPFEGPIEFRTEGKGDSLSVTAYATVEKTKRVVERTVSMAMAKAAGWTSNKKYQEIPEQMLSYRAACFLVRLYCPEVLLGMNTEDELIGVRGSRSLPDDHRPSSAIAAINADVVLLKAEPQSDEPTPEELAKENAQ